MNIDQLKYLIEIGNSHSMNAASEKLHISYQALSHSINTLEKELGLILLKRSHRGSELTPDGYKLVSLSKSFLNGIQSLQSQYNPDVLEINGEVTILTSSICLENFLFDLIELTRKIYPNINFRYYICNSQNEIIANMQKHPNYIGIFFFGFMDLYLYNNNYPHETAVIDLFSSEIRCMCAPMHELAQYQSISLKELSNYNLLVRTTDSAEIIKTDIFDSHHISVEPNPVLFKQKIITSGYVAFCYKVPFAPYWLPQINDSVVRIALNSDNPVKLQLMYNKSFPLTPQAKTFLNNLFKLIGYNKELLY